MTALSPLFSNPDPLVSPGTGSAGGEFHSPTPVYGHPPVLLGPPVNGPGTTPPPPGIHYFGPDGGGVYSPPPAPTPTPGGLIGGGVPHAGGAPGTRVSAGLHPQGDEGRLSGVIQHLMAALGVAKDPNLRESFSTALAALHKHLAGFQKERQDALQGKLSPRLLAEAHAGAGTGLLPPPSGHVDTGYNPAQYQLSIGNTAQAAADWEAHHPYAMSHGQVPAWIEAYLASQHPAVPAAVTNTPAPGLTAL